MAHKDITEKVIGSAYHVYNKMGFGFLESVYEKCLLIELRRAGLKVECQKALAVSYAGENVGVFSADIVVANKVIVELKSAEPWIYRIKTYHPVILSKSFLRIAK